MGKLNRLLKTVLLSLTVMLMFVSSLSVKISADDAFDEAEEAIVEAIESEADAANEASKKFDLKTYVDEAIAIVNEGLAKKNIDEAIETAKETYEKIYEKANETWGAAVEGEEALIKTEEDVDDARHADGYDEAQDLADDAYTQAEIADKSADKAARKYFEAAGEYIKGQIKVDLELVEGLLESKAAVEITNKAKERVAERYEQLVEAKEKAEELKQEAIAVASEAKTELKEAFKQLEDLTIEHGSKIIDKTGNALKTGAALAASKVAVKAAEAVITAYEGKIEVLETKINDLRETIADANEAITLAQAELAALNADDAAYPAALAALNAAIAARDEAQKVYDTANEVKAKMEAAINTAEYISANEAQIKINNAESKETVNVEDIRNLTNYVIKNIADYDEEALSGTPVWIDEDWVGDKQVFAIEVDGETRYFEAKVVDCVGSESTYRIVQYFPAEKVNAPASGQLVSTGETVKKNKTAESNNYFIVGDGSSSLVVNNKNGKLTYQIKVKNWMTTKYYNLQYDVESGSYYYKTSSYGDPIYVKVYQKNVYTCASDVVADVTDSNAIVDKWNAAEHAKSNLNIAKKNLYIVNEKYKIEKVKYDRAVSSLEGIINAYSTHVTVSSEEVERLENQIKEAEHKLNGGLVDRIIRGLITGDMAESNEALRKIADLEGQIILLQLQKIGASASKRELIDQQIVSLREEVAEISGDIKTADQQVEDVRAVIAGLTDGSVDIDDAKNVIKLIQNVSISEKTKLAIAQILEAYFEEAHSQDVAELEEALLEAKEAIGSQLKVVTCKSADFVEAELVLSYRELVAIYNSIAEANYRELKEKADIANVKAKEAYDAYLKLLLSPDHLLDPSLVKQAKYAWDVARKAASDALKNADKAQKIAETYLPNYLNAVTPADIKVVGYEDTGLLYSLIVKDVPNAGEIAEMMGVNYDDAVIFDAYIAEDGERLGPCATVDPLTIYFDIPAKLANKEFKDGNNTRTYTVIRWHDANANYVVDDGELATLATGLSGSCLSVNNDKFSYFAVVAVDSYVASPVDPSRRPVPVTCVD